MGHVWGTLADEEKGEMTDVQKELRLRYSDWTTNQTWIGNVVTRNWTFASGGSSKPVGLRRGNIPDWVDNANGGQTNSSRNTGLGGALHVFAVRSLDPAGNTDPSFSVNNVYAWIYIPPPPIGTIIV